MVCMEIFYFVFCSNLAFQANSQLQRLLLVLFLFGPIQMAPFCTVRPQIGDYLAQTCIQESKWIRCVYFFSQPQKDCQFIFQNDTSNSLLRKVTDY